MKTAHKDFCRIVKLYPHFLLPLFYFAIEPYLGNSDPTPAQSYDIISSIIYDFKYELDFLDNSFADKKQVVNKSLLAIDGHKYDLLLDAMEKMIDVEPHKFAHTCRCLIIHGYGVKKYPFGIVTAYPSLWQQLDCQPASIF